MMPPPLISIILPTYNRENLLRRSVESVLNQTYTNWELIIWDDGSKDNTSSITTHIKDKRIRYYHEENHGKSYALNKAIANSTGEFIAFLDDDDIWLPSKLTLQMNCFLQYPTIEIVFGNYININEEKNEKGLGFEQSHDSFLKMEIKNLSSNLFVINNHLFNGLSCGNFIAFDTAIIRKSALEKVGDFNEKLRSGMDLVLWWKLALAGVLFAFTNDIVMERYKITGSLSSPKLSTFNSYFCALDDCANEAKIHNQKDLIRFLKPQYRNLWQNQITYFANVGETKKMLNAFLRSLKYGFRFGSIRLLIEGFFTQIRKKC